MPLLLKQDESRPGKPAPGKRPDAQAPRIVEPLAELGGKERLSGYGRFVDPTPSRDEVHQPAKAGGQQQALGPRALAYMNLLTVVEHELGHAIGLDDNTGSSAYDLLSGSLATGVRRKASLADIDAVSAAYYGDNQS